MTVRAWFRGMRHDVSLSVWIDQVLAERTAIEARLDDVRDHYAIIEAYWHESRRPPSRNAFIQSYCPPLGVWLIFDLQRFRLIELIHAELRRDMLRGIAE